MLFIILISLLAHLQSILSLVLYWVLLLVWQTKNNCFHQLHVYFGQWAFVVASAPSRPLAAKHLHSFNKVKTAQCFYIFYWVLWFVFLQHSVVYLLPKDFNSTRNFKFLCMRKTPPKFHWNRSFSVLWKHKHYKSTPSFSQKIFITLRSRVQISFSLQSLSTQVERLF